MPKFALVEIESINGIQKFYKLVKDGKCEFDEFELEAGINYPKEMKRIYSILNRVARNVTLTKDMLKDITPVKELIKEYEFKTHHLRVYAIHEAMTGKVIICGGYKTRQKKDIAHFRELKNQYYTYKELV